MAKYKISYITRDGSIPNFLPMPISTLKKIPILAYLTQAKKDTFPQFNEISQLSGSNALRQSFLHIM